MATIKKPPILEEAPLSLSSALTGTPVADQLDTQEKKKRYDGRVAAFPMERFLQFISVMKILTKDYGMIGLELLGSQKYVLQEIIDGLGQGVTTFVILKNRQAGISTLCLAIDLFWAFENPGLMGVFGTHDEGSRDQFRNQIDLFLTMLPENYKVGDNTNNRLMMVLQNASIFRYLVAGTRQTGNTMGRSGGCNYCHATEVAFWGSKANVDALTQTFSEKFPHRLYIFESTANGFNHFHDMWEVAEGSPAQKAIFVGWYRDERNQFNQEHPLYKQYMPMGAATPLKQLERDRLVKVKTRYGLTLNAGQIAWYRFHLETKCGGDQHAMDQEMPWLPEDAFIATGTNFFSTESVTDAMRQAGQFKCLPFMIKTTENFQDTRMFHAPVERAEFKIWEKPSKYGKYIIGADPIFGSSPEKSNAVINVTRAYGDVCEQVAEFASDTCSQFQFAWVLAFICGLYKDVYVVLEMNGPGQAVFGEMKQLRQKLAQMNPKDDPDIRNCLLYMKDFLYRRVDSLSGGVLLQWQTSPKTREQLLHKFHIGIEAKRMLLKSKAAIEEARHLVIETDGYIGAPSSKNDDRVFGAALSYYGWDMNVRPALAAQRLTKAAVLDIEKRGGADPVQGLITRFLKDANIMVKDI